MAADPIILVGIFVAVPVFAGLMTTALSCFRRCGPNQAMIVSGMFACTGEHDFKIVVGGGSVVMPVVQQCAYLSLEAMSVNVRPDTAVITADGTQLTVAGIAQVKIPSDAQSIATAAQHLLSKTEEEIIGLADVCLSGSLRAAIGQMDYADVMNNQREISEKIQAESAKSLSKLGLTILSFHFKNLTPYGKLSPQGDRVTV